MWKHFPSENMFMQHQHQKAIFLFSLMTLSDTQQHNERCCCYSFSFPWSLCFHGNIISEDNSCARIYSTHGPDTLILMYHQEHLFFPFLSFLAFIKSPFRNRNPGLPFCHLLEGRMWHTSPLPFHVVVLVDWYLPRLVASEIAETLIQFLALSPTCFVNSFLPGEGGNLVYASYADYQYDEICSPSKCWQKALL